MKIILTLIAISEVCFSNAQDYFNYRYPFNALTWDGALSVLVLPDGYLIGGGSADTVFGYYQNIAFMKIDLPGNELWKNQFGKNYYNYYLGGSGSMSSVTENHFVFGGAINDTNGFYYALLTKFDSIGDTLWTKKYRSGNNQGYATYQCKPTLDKGFILIGVSDAYDIDGDILLLKTDSIGNLEWQKNIGTAYLEYGFYIEVTSDSGYFISGIEALNSGSPGNGWVIKTDKFGNMQWSKYIGGPLDEGAPAITKTSDGGYLLAAGYATKHLADINYDARRVNMLKLDSAGNIIWSKQYGPSRYALELEAVHELSDGSFVAAGQKIKREDAISGVVDGLMLKINAQGDSIWYWSYEYFPCDTPNGGGDNYPRDMKPTADGGFIVVGFYQVASSCGDTGTQDMWVFKTDSCGCLQPGCNPPPMAGFTYATDSVTVTFTNTSAGAYAYSWDFGDGDTFFTYESRVNEKNPVHTYSDTGVYPVTLVAITCGATDTLRDTISLKITDVTIMQTENAVYKIYPNPGNYEIIIEPPISCNVAGGDVFLYDLLSNLHEYKIVRQGNKYIIDVKKLSAGMYYLKMVINNEIVVNKKLIIAR